MRQSASAASRRQAELENIRGMSDRYTVEAEIARLHKMGVQAGSRVW